MKLLKTIRNLAFYLGLYTIIQILMGIIFGIVNFTSMQGMTTDEANTFMQGYIYTLTGIAAIFTLIIYAIVLKIRKRNIIKICNFKKIGIKDGIYTMLISLGIAILSCSLVTILQDKFEYNVGENLSNANNIVLTLFIAIILIPIFEEILFRGLIFNDLRSKYNIVVAVLIQGLIFGVMHGNIIQGIYTVILGVILSMIYIWTDSIYVCIIGHTTYNLLGTLVVPNIFESINEKIIYFLMIIGIILIGIFCNLMYKNRKELKVTTTNV